MGGVDPPPERITARSAAQTPMVRDAGEFLSNLDAEWANHIASVGPVRLEPKPEREPYEALVRAIAYQQLHAKAGDAILMRLRGLFPERRFPTPADLVATSAASLRACGLSESKVATIHGLARATLEGIVPSLQAARAMADDELIDRLVVLRGVGRWTVEMFLIYSLDAGRSRCSSSTRWSAPTCFRPTTSACATAIAG